MLGAFASHLFVKREGSQNSPRLFASRSVGGTGNAPNFRSVVLPWQWGLESRRIRLFIGESAWGTTPPWWGRVYRRFEHRWLEVTEGIFGNHELEHVRAE